MTNAETIHHASVISGLSFLWLEITAKCNLFCTHCYAGSGPQSDLYGNMAYDDWTRVLDQAGDLGCRRIQFIGGEPTMHPRLADLVLHARYRGFDFIEVFTNATRLGRKLLGCFQCFGVHVATSFYSGDPDVHEQVTQEPGSWQRTVSGIESVLTAGLPIRVGVIETERNVGHGPRAIEFLRTLGVQNARIDRERGVGRGKLEHGAGDAERYEELCGECWKGKLCVTSTGEVFPCVFARATRLGVVKSGLMRILLASKLMEFRRTVRAAANRGRGCLPASCDPAPSTQKVVGQHCNPEATCNPDTCNPNDCNPNAPCNPDACNPNICNPNPNSCFPRP
jgi:MoaA/NifB/PqqE/SkfB family radical SAM enzyme